MKRLILSAGVILLASPLAFASDAQICNTHLEELQGHDVEKLRKPSRQQVENHIELAKKAEESDDYKNCIIHASKALQELEAPGPPHTSERGGSDNSNR